jgi:2Fe-2S ferredoxin
VKDSSGREHVVEARTGTSIMEVLRELDYGVAAICGGICSCATCHVYVAAEWVDRLPDQHGDERELLEGLDSWNPGRSRLSCQIPFTSELDGIEVEIAPEE